MDHGDFQDDANSDLRTVKSVKIFNDSQYRIVSPLVSQNLTVGGK